MNCFGLQQRDGLSERLSGLRDSTFHRRAGLKKETEIKVIPKGQGTGRTITSLRQEGYGQDTVPIQVVLLLLWQAWAPEYGARYSPPTATANNKQGSSFCHFKGLNTSIWLAKSRSSDCSLAAALSAAVLGGKGIPQMRDTFRKTVLTRNTKGGACKVSRCVFSTEVSVRRTELWAQ